MQAPEEEHGIHLLEFSVVLFLGLSLLLGIVDLMHYLQVQTALQNGAEYSARLLAKASPTSQSQAFELAAKEVKSMLPLAEYPCIKPTAGCLSFSTEVKVGYVSVTATFQLPLYILANATDELTSTARFRQQNTIVDDAPGINNAPCEEVGCSW